MIDTVLITFENTEILNVPVAKSVARTTAQITSTTIIFVMKERFLSSGSGSSGSIPILPKNGLYVTAYTTIPRNARTAHAANATGIRVLLRLHRKVPELLHQCWKLHKKSCKRCHVFHRIHHRIFQEEHPDICHRTSVRLPDIP